MDIKYKDCSLLIKIAIILSYVTGITFGIAFLIGFIKGLLLTI